MLKQIHIEYIYGSGFAIRFEDRLFIFDYTKGDLPDIDRPTSFLVTSKDKDHYNPDILDIEGDNINYILAESILSYDKTDNIIDLGGNEDIRDMQNLYSKRASYMKAPSFMDFSSYTVTTFPDGGEGLAYLISHEGINIFHAGSYNLRILAKDSDEEVKEKKRDFENILDLIASQNIDIAIFPLEPKLKENYDLGFKSFADKLQPSIILPMAFKDDISYNLKFMSANQDLSGSYRPIFKSKQFFIVNYEA